MLLTIKCFIAWSIINTFLCRCHIVMPLASACYLSATFDSVVYSHYLDSSDRQCVWIQNDIVNIHRIIISRWIHIRADSEAWAAACDRHSFTTSCAAHMLLPGAEASASFCLKGKRIGARGALQSHRFDAKANQSLRFTEEATEQSTGALVPQRCEAPRPRIRKIGG